jgi:hypothetical protein
LYAVGTYLSGSMSAYQPFGIHPFLIGCSSSLIAAIGICLVTAPPREELVIRFFYRRITPSRKRQPE